MVCALFAASCGSLSCAAVRRDETARDARGERQRQPPAATVVSVGCSAPGPGIPNSCAPEVRFTLSRSPVALRRAAGRGAILLSVCSGAFILGAAGLLDGRKCTTHWRHVDELQQRFPAAVIDPDVLFVDDGALITSAGTAAGIDACLHLVRRELGSAAANTIARRMVVPPQRDGGQRQYIERPIPQCSSDGLGDVLAYLVANLDAAHTVAELAARAHMSTRSFARRFAAETGTTPVQWLASQRVLHAQRLLEDTALDVEQVARRCGFATAALLRHHFRRALGVSPSDYRRTFCSSPA